jgi:hypothetical protein
LYINICPTFHGGWQGGRGQEFTPSPEILEINKNWKKKVVYISIQNPITAQKSLKLILEQLKRASTLFFCPPPFQKHPGGTPIAIYIYIMGIPNQTNKKYMAR